MDAVRSTCEARTPRPRPPLSARYLAPRLRCRCVGLPCTRLRGRFRRRGALSATQSRRQASRFRLRGHEERRRYGVTSPKRAKAGRVGGAVRCPDGRRPEYLRGPHPAAATAALREIPGATPSLSVRRSSLYPSSWPVPPARRLVSDSVATPG